MSFSYEENTIFYSLCISQEMDSKHRKEVSNYRREIEDLKFQLSEKEKQYQVWVIWMKALTYSRLSNSKGLTETLWDIRTLTYQVERFEENNKLNNHI